MEFQRREVTFSGRVQGVGFRYTTQRISSRHQVSGFVRNLPDGRVQLVVEGRSGDIDAFIGEIQHTLDANITSVDSAIMDHRAEFQDFQIRR